VSVHKMFSQSSFFFAVKWWSIESCIETEISLYYFSGAYFGLDLFLSDVEAGDYSHLVGVISFDVTNFVMVTSSST